LITRLSIRWNSLLNLSDAMLVLAVGIMLALVIHWNIDVDPRQPGQKAGEKLDGVEEVESGKDVDLDQLEELGKGVIYIDPHSGEIYLVGRRLKGRRGCGKGL